MKFVCGYNPSNVGVSLGGADEGEPSVKFGNYATEINLASLRSPPRGSIFSQPLTPAAG